MIQNFLDDIGICDFSDHPQGATASRAQGDIDIEDTLGLFDGVNKALADKAIRAIVLTGMHRAFIAGADISEFGKAASEGAGLHEVLTKMEGSTKPIIAAINGTAFGGGLEVALCCDYRVAAATAPVGLPEVKLGLLPGAGGTQRLPRLIGVEQSVAAITSGDPILAPAALKMGIVDEVATGDVVEAAIKFADKVLSAGGKTRKIRDLEEVIARDRANPGVIDRARGTTAEDTSRPVCARTDSQVHRSSL